MEICEHEFLRSLGLSVDMEDENSRFGWPRVKASCRFKRPLRFEEEVEVKLIVAEIRDRSIRYAFQFWKEENGEQVKAAVGKRSRLSLEQATGSMKPHHDSRGGSESSKRNLLGSCLNQPLFRSCAFCFEALPQRLIGLEDFRPVQSPWLKG